MKNTDKYDLLIVGSGLMGSIIAYEASLRKLKVLVIEKRNHIGGNCYTEKIENINVHKYGAHIFHTNDKKIWDYINQFSKFNNFINTPMAVSGNRIYNLPFNLNTFYQVYGTYKINEVRKILSKESKEFKNITPRNLEEQAIKFVGRKLYNTLIKGYTEKQWGLECSKIPPSIIKRLPIRMDFNNNYFNDSFQGIPVNGYTNIFKSMLKNVKVILSADYKDFIKKVNYDKMIFTGKIDEYYNYIFGELEYRSLIFKNKILNTSNYQGNAVFNYIDKEIKHTRIIEHKHFENSDSKKTVISFEYPLEYKRGKGIDPFYPIEINKNEETYKKYLEHSRKDKNVFFLGRLSEYKYYDMDKVIERALSSLDRIFAK